MDLRELLRLVGAAGLRAEAAAVVDSFTSDRVRADILAVADAAAADRFAWYGYSCGGVVGLQLAARTDHLTALVCGGWPPLGAPYDRMPNYRPQPQNDPINRQALRHTTVALRGGQNEKPIAIGPFADRLQVALLTFVAGLARRERGIMHSIQPDAGAVGAFYAQAVSRYSVYTELPLQRAVRICGTDLKMGPS